MELASVHNCVACPLAATRHVIVDGHGPLKSRVLFVGEGPGEREDLSGTPFIGQSGKLLRHSISKVLALLGLPNEDVRLTNSVRCRPPDNRDPTSHELAMCRPWLLEEIEAMPNLTMVVAVGKIAMYQVMQVWGFLGGSETWKVFQVLHPAYVLRMRRHTRDFEEQIEWALREAYDLGHPRRIVDDWAYGWPSYDDPYFAMDTETDDLGEGVGVKMVGYSQASPDVGDFTVHTGADFEPYLTTTAAPHIWLHNAKYDLPLLGIDPYDFKRWDDTMLGIYVLRQHDRVGLKEVAPRITGLHWDLSITELLKERINVEKTLKSGKIKTTQKWVKVPFSRAIEARWDDARRYATTDAIQTSRLARYVTEQFERHPWAQGYYNRIEKPQVPILLGMETRGIEIDLDQLKVAGTEIDARLNAAETSLHEYIPDSISLTSGKQLGPWLLANGLVDGKLTETGQIGTAKANILGAFGVERREYLPLDTTQGQIADLLLEAAAMRKLDSTYVKRLTEDAPRDPLGRIHPRFNQAATATDRLSSSDPNAQNIPTRGELGAVLRRAFRARAGYRLVVADYSQLELRIWAEVTQDPFFINAFVGANQYDPHGRLAERLSASGFKVSRSDAKTVNFAALYGADDAKIAATAKIPRWASSAFIDELRALAPSLSSHKRETQWLLDTQGYVETLVGWRGYYPLVYSPISSEQQAALREAGNNRIQGTASGIVKDLMIEYDNEIAPAFELPRHNGTVGGLLLQAHDELVIEVLASNADKVAYKLEALGAEVGRKWLKTVPLVLPVGVGPNWGEAKPK